MIVVPSKGAVLIPRDVKYIPALKEIKPYAKLNYKGTTHFVAHHDLRTSRILARNGHAHQGPIRTAYDWPGRYTPFEHQYHTADFLTQHIRGYCFNGLRTGKTLSALWAADWLISQGAVQRVMVITTLTTVDRVWANELFLTFPHRTATVLHGSYAKRIERLNEHKDFYILNHDGAKLLTEKYERSGTTLYTLIEEMKLRTDIDLIIVDEGAIFRNKQTHLWAALNTLCGPNTGRALWWLTGNPTPNSPTDAWAQAKLVTPERVPQFFGRFRRQVMYQVSQFKWMEQDSWENVVYDALQPSIRYKRSDCTDMPPPTIEDVVVKMSKSQQMAYDSMRKTFVIEHAEGKITAANEGVKQIKLLQVACGLVYSADGSVDLDAGPKYKKLLELIEDADNKALVLLPFRDMVDTLAKQLTKSGYSTGVVKGGVSRNKRNEIFREFQEGFLNVICAHPKTMAHGIDLTSCNTIIWWGPTGFELYEQAVARIDGPKQTRDQQVWHLICSPIEQKMYDRLRKRESTNGVLLDMLREGN